MTKVYVGGLSWDTTSDSLRDYFEECGKVTDSFVVQDRNTGRSKGFGFVTYESKEEAEAAVRDKNQTELDGRTIRVDVANDRPPRPDRRRDEGGDSYRRRDDRGGYRRDEGRGGDRHGGDRRRDYGDRDARRSNPYDREERGGARRREDREDY